MNDKKKSEKPKNTCALCGKMLRYPFEIESGVCETCQLSRKVKSFEQFNTENNIQKNEKN